MRIKTTALITLLIIVGFWPLQANAGYQLDYDLKIGAVSIGDISLAQYSNVITARISIMAGGPLSFEQDIRCFPAGNRKVYIEESSFKRGNNIHTRRTMVRPGRIQIIQLEKQKTNTFFRTDRRSGFTFLSFFHSFLKGELKQEPDYTLFLKHRFVEMNMTSLSTNRFFLTDRNQEYSIEVQYRKEGKYRVPEQIDFRKYRIFGINLYLFNCSLKSCSRN
ncbi:MAG: hypothetical protein PHF84_11590 [bacterium]|nr:hypothetical protein [bacterium]